MDMKIISHGAEAKIIQFDDSIIKYRISKSYRIPEIDKSIIKRRTKSEQNNIKKLLEKGINVPILLDRGELYKKITSHGNTSDIENFKTYNQNNTIFMQCIKGLTISEFLRNNEQDTCNDMFIEFGKLISNIHDCDIVHGDITLNNFIVNDRIYAIDFGLSFASNKDEDKAVDLYVFERALICTYDCGIEYFYKGYTNANVIKRLETVRMRGRKREESALG